MVYNAYIAIPFATWLIAQLIKFTIKAFTGKVDFRYLYASGGMPSVHSAIVCSLATTALLIDGMGSHLFGITVIFAAVVMYDSFGVRRASGEQAVAINQIVDNLRYERPGVKYPARLREMFGHKPGEVIVGAILGVVLAGLFNTDRLTSFLAYISTAPGKIEQDIYLGLFVLLVIIGFVVKLVLSRKFRKSAALKPVFGSVATNVFTIGILGVLFGLAQFEKLTYLAWRVWPQLLIILWVVWAVFIGVRYVPTVGSGLAREREEARKAKWLEGNSKRKSKKHRK
jgi:acid phosphatase family membrane protein YuiD